MRQEHRAGEKLFVDYAGPTLRLVDRETGEIRLRHMKLGAMADAYARQVQDPNMQGLTFEERFTLLVDHEFVSRQNHRQPRLIRGARLKVNAAPEEVEHHASRTMDHTLLRSLTTGQWISEHHNLLIIGPTGVGKTFVACALGTAACRQNLHVRYFRVSRLLQDIHVAKGDGSYARLQNQLRKVDLLTLDDLGQFKPGVDKPASSVSSRWTYDTRISRTQRWPTPYSTGAFTTRTGFKSRENRCER